MSKTKHKTPKPTRSSKELVGTISFARTGRAFVWVPEKEREYQIAPGDTHTALPKDTVAIAPLSAKQAKVVAVKERAVKTIVGTAVRHGGHFLLVPDDARFPVDFLLTNIPSELKEGEVVAATFQKWDDPDEQPTAAVRTILGKAGTHEARMRAIVYAHEFSDEFPPAVLREAKEIQARFHAGGYPLSPDRRDMRDRLTVTIDPDDAKDFDDAISLQKRDDGTFELGVHIADVTHFVRPNTATDKEARHRATSIYLVDRTIHMLPEPLSADVCSLRPHEDRFAFSVIFTITKEGVVHDFTITRTLIRSDARLSYRQAQDLIDQPDGSPLADMLANLITITRALREKRNKAGALQFASREVSCQLDETGRVQKISVKPQLESMALIEELMLLANKTVAEFYQSVAPSETLIFRVHDEPDPEKFAELKTFVEALGFQALSHLKEAPTNKDLARLLQEIKGTPQQSLIEQTLLRSMAKAVYTHKNIGHFSLGFPAYVHFTSPIRRYPDIMVHRLLKAHLDGSPLSQAEVAAYQKLAEHATKREIEAQHAERDSVAQKQAEYMADHIGEVFTGTITGVTERGLFVAENKTLAEGFIPIASLPGFYTYDQKAHRLINKKEKGFQLGDQIRIRCKAVDIDERKITWELAQ